MPSQEARLLLTSWNTPSLSLDKWLKALAWFYTVPLHPVSHIRQGPGQLGPSA